MSSSASRSMSSRMLCAPLNEGGELRLGDDAVLVGVRLLQDLLELLHNLRSFFRVLGSFLENRVPHLGLEQLPVLVLIELGMHVVELLGGQKSLGIFLLICIHGRLLNIQSRVSESNG